jgi:hypothetical protein
MKTIPLAPIKPKLKNITFKIPVIKEVAKIIIKVALEPYFSSMIGPMRRMKERLPSKCSALICPNTCEKSENIDKGLPQSIDVPTENNCKTPPLVANDNAYTIVQSNEKDRMTGELNLIDVAMIIIYLAWVYT